MSSPLRPTLLALTLALVGGDSRGEPAPTPAPTSACPAPHEIEPIHLYGLWELQLWPTDRPNATPSAHGVLRLERHPEYPGSVRGEWRRSPQGNAVLAQVAGDVTDGVFLLDESADGVTMSAVWEGDVHDCGRSLRGIRRIAEGQPNPEPPQHFHLFRRSGWR